MKLVCATLIFCTSALAAQDEFLVKVPAAETTIPGSAQCTLKGNSLQCSGKFHTEEDGDFDIKVPKEFAFSHPVQVVTGGNFACVLERLDAKCWSQWPYRKDIFSFSDYFKITNPTAIAAAASSVCLIDAYGTKCVSAINPDSEDGRWGDGPNPVLRFYPHDLLKMRATSLLLRKEGGDTVAYAMDAGPKAFRLRITPLHPNTQSLFSSDVIEACRDLPAAQCESHSVIFSYKWKTTLRLRTESDPRLPEEKGIPRLSGWADLPKNIQLTNGRSVTLIPDSKNWSVQIRIEDKKRHLVKLFNRPIPTVHPGDGSSAKNEFPLEKFGIIGVFSDDTVLLGFKTYEGYEPGHSNHIWIEGSLGDRTDPAKIRFATAVYAAEGKEDIVAYLPQNKDDRSEWSELTFFGFERGLATLLSDSFDYRTGSSRNDSLGHYDSQGRWIDRIPNSTFHYARMIFANGDKALVNASEIYFNPRYDVSLKGITYEVVSTGYNNEYGELRMMAPLQWESTDRLIATFWSYDNLKYYALTMDRLPIYGSGYIRKNQ